MSPRANFDDRLGGYVEVKDRIAQFYAKYPDGRLTTTEVRVTAEPDGVPRVWAEAAAYRTADDPHPAKGWSWMVLPGTTPYTRGSEIENTETSAWGRAIGALGIGIDKSIASANEVRTKQTSPAPAVSSSAAGASHSDGLTGTVEVGDKRSSDFLVRQTPDGAALGFRLRGERGGILVECVGPLAEQLFAFKDATVGAHVTVWGTISDRTFTPKPKAGEQPRDVTFQVLTAERVRVPEVGDLPTESPAPVSVAPARSEDDLDGLAW